MMTGSSVSLSSFRTRLLVTTSTLIISCTFLALSFVLGALFAGTALHDPDSCWLLALGRIIFTNRALPQTDPFSYTFANLNQTFVMYQWLTELTLYTCFNLLGLSGMLMFFAVVIAMTLLCIPLMLSAKLAGTRLFAFILSVLLVGSATTHTLLRPEIFSYLFLSLWLSIVILWRKAIHSASEASVVPVFYLALLMLFWANMHSAFTIGLLVLALLAISYLLESQFVCLIPLNHIKLLFAALAGASAATLINPNFTGLWAYLPGLYFSPMNTFIDELKPLGYKEIQNPIYYPFFALSVIAVILLIQQILHWGKREEADKRACGFLFSLAIIALAIIAGIQTRRMIPFSAIILALESLFLCYLRNLPRQSEASNGMQASLVSATKGGLWHLTDARLEEFFTPSLTNCSLTVGLLSLLGAYLTVARIQPPKLPQGSVAFKAPEQAVRFLANNPQKGNVFNDAQYGDVLIWYSPGNPRVFVDTRFDMYGEKFVRDFQCMRFATPGFERLFQHYKISWAFLPASASLAKQLLQDQSWKEVYSDEISVILHKQ
jgi:hypothetical protein